MTFYRTPPEICTFRSSFYKHAVSSLFPLQGKAIAAFDFSESGNQIIDKSGNSNHLNLSWGSLSDFSFESSPVGTVAIALQNDGSGYSVSLGDFSNIAISHWFYLNTSSDIMWVTLESSNRDSTQLWSNDAVFMVNQWGSYQPSHPNWRKGWNYAIWWWGDSGSGSRINGIEGGTDSGNDLLDVELRVGNAVKRSTSGTKVSDLVIYQGLTQKEIKEVSQFYGF